MGSEVKLTLSHRTQRGKTILIIVNIVAAYCQFVGIAWLPRAIPAAVAHTPKPYTTLLGMLK